MGAANDIDRTRASLALPDVVPSGTCNIGDGDGQASTRHRVVLRSVIAYTISVAMVWYVARGVSWVQIETAIRHATVWLFIGVSLTGFLSWFIGETMLYSCLFGSFHGRTRARELLPTMAAMYFVQIVNSLVASGVLILFLHRRKRVPWMTAGGTLLFLAYADAMVLVTLLIISIVFLQTSVLRPALYYAAGVVIAGSLIGSFFLFWGRRLSANNSLRWIYDRPSMVTCRRAPTVAFHQTGRYQVFDLSGCRPRALWPVR